ncbi:hypothetical protein V6U90_11650 [Micromonospora sp. CPCC 206060]|uniref:hypothetical protein n=1 Tax=Micromonospora sp. CPCC 206060 TaxID=3122406 RepID=UPI002FEE7B29
MQPPAGSQVSRVPAQRTPSEQYAPPPVAPPPVPKPRRVRRVLAVVAGVLALLCVGGTAVGYVLYDRATTPDRSSPTIVVDSFLRAYFIDRDDVLVELYTCPDSLDRLAAIRDLRADLEQRQNKFQIQMLVSWGRLQVEERSSATEVRVDIIFSAYVNGVSQSERQAWVFETRFIEEWRVCSATRAG